MLAKGGVRMTDSLPYGIYDLVLVDWIYLTDCFGATGMAILIPIDTFASSFL